MNLFKDILRGVVIGIANAIPGVSGGTMMVSMGIYDKLIYSVTQRESPRIQDIMRVFCLIVLFILTIEKSFLI